MSSQYNELWPTNGADRFGSLGHPQQIFNGFRVLALLPHRRRSTEVNQTARCLAVSWAVTLYIHFWGSCPLTGAKFTLRPSLTFFYIGSVTARHLSSGRHLDFTAWYKE